MQLTFLERIAKSDEREAKGVKAISKDEITICVLVEGKFAENVTIKKDDSALKKDAEGVELLTADTSNDSVYALVKKLDSKYGLPTISDLSISYSDLSISYKAEPQVLGRFTDVRNIEGKALKWFHDRLTTTLNLYQARKYINDELNKIGLVYASFTSYLDGKPLGVHHAIAEKGSKDSDPRVATFYEGSVRVMEKDYKESLRALFGDVSRKYNISVRVVDAKSRAA